METPPPESLRERFQVLLAQGQRTLDIPAPP
jgi:hypothetical protein